GAAELDQHRTGRVVLPAAGEPDRSQLVIGSSIGARSHEPDPNEGHFSAARSTRHMPSANGSTTQISVVVPNWAHCSPDRFTLENSGACAVPGSIHGWTSRSAAQMPVTTEKAIGTT